LKKAADWPRAVFSDVLGLIDGLDDGRISLADGVSAGDYISIYMVDFKLFCVQGSLESLLKVFPSRSDARDAAQKPLQ
jgi:hypothetical protein